MIFDISHVTPKLLLNNCLSTTPLKQEMLNVTTMTMKQESRSIFLAI